MEHASGRSDKRFRDNKLTQNRAICDTINMEQKKPEWVFKLEVPLTFFNPPDEYKIYFRRRIPPERLFKILKEVEDKIEFAFIY